MAAEPHADHQREEDADRAGRECVGRAVWKVDSVVRRVIERLAGASAPAVGGLPRGPLVR